MSSPKRDTKLPVNGVLPINLDDTLPENDLISEHHSIISRTPVTKSPNIPETRFTLTSESNQSPLKMTLTPERSQSPSNGELVQPVASFPVLDLNDLDKIPFKDDKPLICITNYQDNQHILKLFTPEDKLLLNQELRTYEILSQHQCSVVPKFMASVYTDNIDDPQRIIGFVCELLFGREPGFGDLEDCKTALTEIHKCGVVHCDLEEIKNLIITDNGPRFIDFEFSKLLGQLSEGDLEKAKDKDVKDLTTTLQKKDLELVDGEDLKMEGD